MVFTRWSVERVPGERARGSSGPGLSGRTHCDDFEQGFKAGEVGWVPRIYGELGGHRRGRNQEVDRSTTSRFASSAGDRGVHKSVGTSCRYVKRNRLEGRLGSLKAILATCALGWVGGHVGASSQLRECDRRHCDLRRQSVLGDLFDFDDDRGVDKTAGMPPIRHAGSCPGRSPRLRLTGSGLGRLSVRAAAPRTRRPSASSAGSSGIQAGGRASLRDSAER
jgi:hypothetical protein